MSSFRDIIPTNFFRKGSDRFRVNFVFKKFDNLFFQFIFRKKDFLSIFIELLIIEIMILSQVSEGLN